LYGGSDTSGTYVKVINEGQGFGILCARYCNMLLQYSLSTAFPFTDKTSIIYVRAEMSINDYTAQLAERAE